MGTAMFSALETVEGIPDAITAIPSKNEECGATTKIGDSEKLAGFPKMRTWNPIEKKRRRPRQLKTYFDTFLLHPFSGSKLNFEIQQVVKDATNHAIIKINRKKIILNGRMKRPHSSIRILSVNVRLISWTNGFGICGGIKDFCRGSSGAR